MTNGYHTDHSHTNYGLFFLLTTKYFIIYWKNRNPEYEEMRQICDMRRNFNNTMTSRIGQRAAIGLHVLCAFSNRLVWEMFDRITAEILI